LDVVAESNADAEHRVYSIIGSRHKAGRRQIISTHATRLIHVNQVMRTSSIIFANKLQQWNPFPQMRRSESPPQWGGIHRGEAGG